jgi:hypothetical protein
MKNFLIIFFAIFTVASLYSHPPSGAKFKYDDTSDTGTGILSVTVKHDVKKSRVNDPEKHFVKEVILSVNGNKVEKQTFSKQDSSDGLQVIFKVILKYGDRITIKASCNLGGKKTVNFVILKK